MLFNVASLFVNYNLKQFVNYSAVYFKMTTVCLTFSVSWRLLKICQFCFSNAKRHRVEIMTCLPKVLKQRIFSNLCFEVSYFCSAYLMFYACISSSSGIFGAWDGGSGNHHGELLHSGDPSSPKCSRVYPVLQPQRAQNGQCTQSG